MWKCIIICCRKPLSTSTFVIHDDSYVVPHFIRVYLLFEKWYYLLSIKTFLFFAFQAAILRDAELRLLSHLNHFVPSSKLITVYFSRFLQHYKMTACESLRTLCISIRLPLNVLFSYSPDKWNKTLIELCKCFCFKIATFL